MRTYLLPLLLITQGKWLRISHAAKAILPAIGIHADNSGIAFPGIKLIMELSGIGSNKTVIEGIRSLISLDLIEKEKKDGHNIYFLKPPAILCECKSYFPMTEEFIRFTWTEMSYIEKAVFAVLAVKAEHNNPDKPEDAWGIGMIQKKKWRRLAGIARSKWNTAINELIEKEIIVLEGENGYYVYE